MVRRSCTVLFLVVMLISCKKETADDQGIVFWTPSAPPTQTPWVLEITTTPVYTYTPIVKEVTSTPKPEYLCVTAVETVHLRPSPSVQNYPITVLQNGTRLTDLGGRSGNWAFVSNGEEQGWINLDFVKNCE